MSHTSHRFLAIQLLLSSSGPTGLSSLRLCRGSIGLRGRSRFCIRDSLRVAFSFLRVAGFIRLIGLGFGLFLVFGYIGAGAGAGGFCGFVLAMVVAQGNEFI